MSLTRSEGQGARRISVVFAIVFPAMIAAALALAYFGYLDAHAISAVVESLAKTAFARDAESQAAIQVSTFEAELNREVAPVLAETARRMDDPNIPVAEKCALDLPPMVQAMALYPAGGRARVCSTHAMPKKVLLHLDEAHERAPERPHKGGFFYEHRRNRNDELELLVRARHPEGDVPYDVVLVMNHQRIRDEKLRPALERLAKQWRVSLVDERNAEVPRLSFGEPAPSLSDPFANTVSGGSALFMYRIVMVPPASALRALEDRKRSEGVRRPVLVILSTVIMAGGLGIVLVAVVAERRASRLKSDFIANVSHELKTPLSLIRMFGEMVATGRHKGETAAREYGGIITREAERLSHLIDNVLDFARLERGKASYDFTEGDIAALLDRALDICRYRVEKEKLRLRTIVDPTLPPVRMDENAVTLVVLNLVDNAIKYGADGGEVVVSLSRSPGGVVLGVRDFGPGIPKDEQTRVFDRFYRAANARERNVRGSGIGLALVKHIAEAHGGRVTLESPVLSADPPGPGALFRVFLPAPISEVHSHDATEPHDVQYPVTEP